MQFPAPFYTLTPMDRHYDYGLGSMADGFHEAANTLLKTDVCHESNLPALFLMRHSVELYLKSLILIINRLVNDHARLPLKEIKVHGRSIDNTHSIHSLYATLVELIDNHRDELQEVGDISWIELQAEYLAHVDLIEEDDRNGTYLRYPSEDSSEKGLIKSVFKPFASSQHFQHNPSMPPTVTMLVANDNREIREGFQLDRDVLNNLQKALVAMATMLHALHFGVRMTLTSGW